MGTPQSLDEWASFLKDRSLPLLKTTCEQLKPLGPLEDVSMARFSNVVLTDPGLTLTLLRAASQRHSKHLQGEVPTIDNAAMILGIACVEKIIQEMSCLDDLTDARSKEHYMQVVARTYHGAYQAYSMARIRVDMIPEEIFTASMLQQVAALMLLVHAPAVVPDVAFLDNEKIQQQALGFTLQQLSQRLSQEWNLSHFIQLSLDKEEHDNNPRIYEIHLAGHVAQAAERGWETEEMEKLLEDIAAHLHIGIAEVQSEIRDTAIQSAEETPFYGVENATTKLLEEENSAAEDAENMPKDASQNTPKTVPTPPAASRNNDELERIIAELETLLQGPFQLPQLMTLLKQGFHSALGLNQAFFAMLAKDRKHLASRFIFGSQKGFRNLRIPIIRGNLFERLLEKPQAIWVRDDNRQKIIRLIPLDFYKLIDVDNFFLTTICIKGKPLGLVYGDRHGSSERLDDIDYQNFRRLCKMLARGFEQLSH